MPLLTSYHVTMTTDSHHTLQKCVSEINKTGTKDSQFLKINVFDKIGKKLRMGINSPNDKMKQHVYIGMFIYLVTMATDSHHTLPKCVSEIRDQ